jgi:hypothetical protein
MTMGFIDEVAQRDGLTLRAANLTTEELNRLKDAHEQEDFRTCRRIIRPYGVALHDTTPMQTYFTRLLEYLQNGVPNERAV